ncbi:hypothetical protein PCYB_092350 [Plasmodium cynomolgi strain B]|uniref:Uncharacterized protein n=1 Tax=Plasmodium cynomolgi (strain B) TaxID=1120755 RepID=K6UT50_PLACD|nr:hypothetical protein PCYB_092350 [Plasmodium cynomolgi strain B]GAB66449.1 hypothetical protein PCYB_092350 [Plasmodium cynomolgi strain B]
MNNNTVEVVVSHLRHRDNSNKIKHDAHVESMEGSANISLDDDYDEGYASDDLLGELRKTGDIIPPRGQKGGKKRMFKIKKKKSLTPLHNDDFAQGGEAKISDVAMESFAISRKQRHSPLLGKRVVESSNIELTSTLNNKLNPTLSLVASRAVDGLLGGVHKHMQGPFSLDLDAAASTGAPPTPGIQLATNAIAYPQMSLQNVMSANQMAQNPAFNIHPTATNLRDDPGNVNYNEVVTITIGIVICLFLFCFVFGCIVKMCKPKKRRR